jgi:D-amino peptidase
MRLKPERVFISVDMEGICGVVDGTQCSSDNAEYGYYRKLMAEDLNAAIEGCLEAGVKEIVVSDAHGGMRNMQPEDVHEAAILIRGSPKPDSMMEGIEQGFDAALYVGYHAMAGAEKAILAHTISGVAVDAIYVNGRETGEFGLNAALAGWHGVPSVFVAGDAAVGAEAKTFVPSVYTAVVKTAVGRASARCLHPKKGRKIIHETVHEALKHVNEVEPYWVNEPVEIKAVWRSPVMADAVSVLPYMERIDGKTTRYIFDEYPLALRELRAAITIAGTIK